MPWARVRLYLRIMPIAFSLGATVWDLWVRIVPVGTQWNCLWLFRIGDVLHHAFPLQSRKPCCPSIECLKKTHWIDPWENSRSRVTVETLSCTFLIFCIVPTQAAKQTSIAHLVSLFIQDSIERYSQSSNTTFFIIWILMNILPITNGAMIAIPKIPETKFMVCSTSFGWSKSGMTPFGGGAAPREESFILSITCGIPLRSRVTYRRCLTKTVDSNLENCSTYRYEWCGRVDVRCGCCQSLSVSSEP